MPAHDGRWQNRLRRWPLRKFGSLQIEKRVANAVVFCDRTLNPTAPHGKHRKGEQMLVGLGRVELPTYGLGNRRSIQLSYSPVLRFYPNSLPKMQWVRTRQISPPFKRKRMERLLK